MCGDWEGRLGPGSLKRASFTPTFRSVNAKIPPKPMFMTEYYNQEKADTAVDFLRQAWIMQSAFTELSLSAWVHWDLAWGDGSSMVAVYNPWDAAVAAKPVVAGHAGAKGEVWSTTPSVAMQRTGSWTTGQNLTIPPRSVTTLVAVLSGTTGLSRGAAEAATLLVRGRVLTFEGVAEPELELVDLRGRAMPLPVRAAGSSWVSEIPSSMGSGEHVVRISGHPELDRVVAIP